MPSSNILNYTPTPTTRLLRNATKEEADLLGDLTILDTCMRIQVCFETLFRKQLALYLGGEESTLDVKKKQPPPKSVESK